MEQFLLVIYCYKTNFFTSYRRLPKQMIHHLNNFSSYYKLFKKGHPAITSELSTTIKDIDQFMKKKSLDSLNENHVDQLEELVILNEEVSDLTIIPTLKNLKSLTIGKKNSNLLIG